MRELGFIGNNILFNNSLVSVVDANLKVEDGFSVYEVVKVVSGIPVFFESHIQRLLNSLKISNIKGFEITQQQFVMQVKELCEANKTYFGNIELIVVSSSTVNYYIGFIPHSYPPPLSYLNGVKISLIKLERNNPNAKVKHTQVRLKANSFIDKNRVFEVLLVDKNNYITEGSRSNLFYIKGDVVYTAPIERVLPGITRKYIIKALSNLKITFKQQLLSVNELNAVDGAFICGTSPGVMPICNIDNYKLDVKNKLLRSVMLEFNDIVKQYVVDNTQYK